MTAKVIISFAIAGTFVAVALVAIINQGASTSMDPSNLAAASCSGIYSGTRGRREAALIRAASAAGLRCTEAAQFMAQCAHECDSFNTMQEYASGDAYEWRSDLGNNQPGDGRRFKGRGYIQITGRANYQTYGRLIGVDLVNNPTKAEEPDIAAKVALAYWNRIVKPRVSNFADTRAVTRLINGGYNGLQDRINKFAQYERSCQGSCGGGGGYSPPPPPPWSPPPPPSSGGSGQCKHNSPSNKCGSCSVESHCGNWGSGVYCSASKDPKCSGSGGSDCKLCISSGGGKACGKRCGHCNKKCRNCIKNNGGKACAGRCC